MIKKISQKLKGEFLKHFLLLTFATFIGRGIGFFKEMLVANYFGTSKDLDILLFSFTLATTLMGILSGGMESTVLPKYLYYKNKSQNEKNTYLFAVFTVFIVIIFLLSILIYSFGSDLIGLIAPGFSIQDINIASEYLNIFSIYVIFAFLSVFFMILIKAEKKFFFSGAVTSLLPASIMISVYFQHTKGVVSIAYGALIAAMLLLLFSSLKAFQYFSFKSILSNKLTNNYKTIFKNYSVVFGSGLFIGLIGITDQSFATLVGSGGVSSLSYAQKLPSLLDGMIIAILGTILFSTFAENVSLSKHKENKDFYLKTLKMVSFVAFPLVILLSFFSKELVSMVFMRGAFDMHSLMMVYPVQVAFFLKLPFLAIAVISARMMNSFELNHQMLYINVGSFMLNGFLDYILVTSYGVVGIAYATLFTYMWAAALNYMVVMRHFKKVL